MCSSDLPVLVRHFAHQYAHKMHKRIDSIPAEVMAELVHYDWPGNVRELQNVIERAVILSSNGVLCPLVPERISGIRSASPVSPRSATLDDAMRAHILEAPRRRGARFRPCCWCRACWSCSLSD